LGTRIFLADDHKIMREGLRALLEKQDGIEVVAEAEDGRTAVRLVRELLPDVVIMDVSMPDLNGIEATRQIVAQSPHVKVLALSMHSHKRFVEEMLRAGASGYLVKDCDIEELVSAIRAVMVNQVYLSPRVAAPIIEDYVSTSPAAGTSAPSVLTPREREVLQLLAEGKRTKDVASTLHVSVKTVETHRRQIMRKLDIHSLAELVKYALREGLTSPES